MTLSVFIRNYFCWTSLNISLSLGVSFSVDGRLGPALVPLNSMNFSLSFNSYSKRTEVKKLSGTSKSKINSALLDFSC